LRGILQIPADEQVILERYSDSAAAYVTLDSDKPQVYKTLFRAAKAKLKLRLKATIPSDEAEVAALIPIDPPTHEAMPSPIPLLHRMSAETLTPQPIAPVSPIIVRTPEAAPKPVDSEGEAPLPRSFTARQSKSFARTACPRLYSDCD
jgi:next-to-BRCA1 protein 1